jgi:hypothetical protein
LKRRPAYVRRRVLPIPVFSHHFLEHTTILRPLVRA